MKSQFLKNKYLRKSLILMNMSLKHKLLLQSQVLPSYLGEIRMIQKEMRADCCSLSIRKCQPRKPDELIVRQLSLLCKIIWRPK